MWPPMPTPVSWVGSPRLWPSSSSIWWDSSRGTACSTWAADRARSLPCSPNGSAPTMSPPSTRHPALCPLYASGFRTSTCARARPRTCRSTTRRSTSRSASSWCRSWPTPCGGSPRWAGWSVPAVSSPRAHGTSRTARCRRSGGRPTELAPGATAVIDLAGAREGHLAQLMTAAGLEFTRSAELTVHVEIATFEEWWAPFAYRIGPAGEYFATLSPGEQSALRALSAELLPREPIEISGVARAATATRSQQPRPPGS